MNIFLLLAVSLLAGTSHSFLLPPNTFGTSPAQPLSYKSLKHVRLQSSQSENLRSSQPENQKTENTGFPETPLLLHHTALKTRNITLAIQFYSLLGFEPTTKFRAGPARAAWLEQPGTLSSRLELIEVPSWMLNEPEGMKRKAPDLMQRQDMLGQNHFALDVSQSMKEQGMFTLSEWVAMLHEKSLHMFGKKLRVALAPQQQILGNAVYELAFLFDADGALVELLHKQNDLPQRIDSGWEPWDGKGFVGNQE
jgi:catechol 2,3-dioxygenase-like lactoylglutathione lyase family enzyme